MKILTLVEKYFAPITEVESSIDYDTVDKEEPVKDDAKDKDGDTFKYKIKKVESLLSDAYGVDISSEQTFETKEKVTVTFTANSKSNIILGTMDVYFNKNGNGYLFNNSVGIFDIDTKEHKDLRKQVSDDYYSEYPLVSEE